VVYSRYLLLVHPMLHTSCSTSCGWYMYWLLYSISCWHHILYCVCTHLMRSLTCGMCLWIHCVDTYTITPAVSVATHTCVLYGVRVSIPYIDPVEYVCTRSTTYGTLLLAWRTCSIAILYVHEYLYCTTSVTPPVEVTWCMVQYQY
jgi:hypothetical protein